MSSPPPPGGSTPKLYMTPQLAKRKKNKQDALFPSLLEGTTVDVCGSNQQNKGGLNKVYKTNSHLLLQVPRNDGAVAEDEDPDDDAHVLAECKAIQSNIDEVLTEEVGPDQDLVSCNFEPSGCSWEMQFNSRTTQEAHTVYKMKVVLHAAAGNGIGVTNYMVDTLLVPTVPVDPNPLAPPLPGYRAAKLAFEHISLLVRKAVVRLEFPEFPEGCKGRAFREVYQLNARLKSGSFATVCRGTHRSTGRKVAIKCVLRKDLPAADDAAIFDEVAILASLNHPHIIPLIDFFEEKDCYFLVMELMSGGDLFDRIGKKKTYSEADARDLIVKMLKAVAYCHARKIAHCDMKPKNLLLMSEDNDSYIKLADFGFAARVHAPKSLTKQCGTPFFVSPEILMRKPYDQQSDMWSVGCIVFLLLSGNLPFMGRSQKELFRKIVAGKFEFDEEDWQDISEDAKDLVRSLLVLNPDERMTANEAVRHSWLRASRDRLSLSTLSATSQRLKTFNARMKLRSAMIAIDWVSSLKRMSWVASHKKPGSVSNGHESASGALLTATKKTREKQKKAKAKK